MMGSQLLDMLRQGVWASLTGGWYYDPHHKIFTNTFHLYVWLTLFCLPLSFHLYFTTFDWYVWLIYSVLIFVFFATIKLVNRLLHRLFDTGEVYEEDLSPHDLSQPSRSPGAGPGESIGLQDMTGAAARSATPPVSSSSRNSVADTAPGDTRLVHRSAGGRRLERPSSTFDLKVDVHPQAGPSHSQSGPPADSCADSDVVIMVDESPGAGQRPHHEATRALVLEESRSSGQDRADTFYRQREAADTKEVSPGEAEAATSTSSVTTSSQLPTSRPPDTTRRFSHQSNLARSLPSGQTSRLILESDTGSLDLAAILDPSYVTSVRPRSRGHHVRRTKSALVTGPSGGQPPAPSSHPASLEAGISTQYKLELGEAGLGEVTEEVAGKETDSEQRIGQAEFKGSDMDLFTYQEQLEEATKALLQAGQYLESETQNKKYLVSSGDTSSYGNTQQAQTTSTLNEVIDPKGSGPYMPMVGKVSSEAQPAAEEESHNDTGQSLLSSVGLDWLFSDSEPDQPQETRTLRSRSESPKSSSAMISAEPEQRESRDSSHGSSGTDTETRALLTKLECVENILEQSGGSGAIPKRKPPSRRVRGPGHRSGSLDGGRQRDEAAGGAQPRRRPTLEVEDDYSMPATNTLYDDAAGLKLFLDILNGPDGHNKEAEAELRKLIDKRRYRMHDDSGHRKPGEDDDADLDPESRSRRKRLARRRRHNAQSQNDQMTEMVLGGEADTRPGAEQELGVRKREKKSRRQRDNVPHIATDHDDTSTGAVHYFEDEFGNIQTYTFGGETQAAAAVTQGSIASLLKERGEGAGEAEPGGHAHTGDTPRPGSSRSSVSADSSLTVILDSPAMVFQPGGERTRSVESGSVGGGGAGRDSYRSRDSSQAAVHQHWSRDNSVLDYRLYSGHTHGAGPGHAQPPGFRRYNNALHIANMFAENFFERTRPVGGGAVSNSDMTFSASFGASAAGLTRIDESSLTGQLNLSSGVGAQLNVPSHLGTISSVPKVRKYHLMPLPCLKTGVKIWLDRLQLLNILDQDKHAGVTLCALLLSVLVCVLGSMVLQTGSYRDLYLILFCAVQASCHYSLLKSVQPDASSPTHGFNPITVFSRPIYFILCCALVLILDSAISQQVTGFQLYGQRSWFTVSDLKICRDFIIGFILAFPIIFTVGLLPQINTALMYVLETIDIHIFGGNASSSLQASAYCVLRSLVAVVIIFGFAYGGLTESSHSEHAQQVLFSIFCSLSFVISYHLSRASGDPTVVLSLMKRHVMAVLSEDTPGPPATSANNSGVQSPMDDPKTPQDPLPKKLRDTVNARLKNDAIVCSTAAIVVFLVHQSDVFVQAFPTLDIVLWSVTICVGFVLHYLLPHLRKQTPWKCFAAPILAPFEQTLFEVREAARVMWWEKLLLWASALERSVLFPMIFLSAVTHDREVFTTLFGTWGGSLVMTVTLTKCLRCVWSDSSKQYFTLLLCILLFQYDPLNAVLRILSSSARRSPFLLDYFLTTILTHKLVELYLKCQFVITYIAPHQINWGSAFHAFAQPFSVPHSAMLFLQAILSSILSSPLNPLLGSTIFVCSYVRPVKFWERNYNTKRTDHSNTRLASQFEVRNPGADDNNLNSIFYEHLTRSLQHSLAGDLMLGRWGSVQQGDCFVLASDNLNCLVHIIELGNGLCTFQVRGLEFRGTYCQQREVEAISEGVEEDEGCCCCDPGHLPHMLSVNAAFGQRWLAWEVSAVKYVLEGYSISDNSAQSMLQVWDLRKVLILYYVKSIIYYTVRSPKLMEWLENADILAAVRKTLTTDKIFEDVDPIFNANIDEDYDFRSNGITRNSFCNVYLGWLQHCCQARDNSIPSGKDSDVVSLCLSLSLLGRRALGTASNNSLTSVEFFLTGLHALFKGDFRITCNRDEWVFSDMELLRRVVAPAVRMSLKLHQDHFMSPDEYEEHAVLYEAIASHEQNLVISHEGDPAWRHAVLSGAPSLLALRHVVDDGTDEYKIIMLNKRHLSFRVIKLNRECVRGLWAGQQQELIFLRNRNPERGSIQNAKQALRNIINSSCDQPIGYPIYVSPLTTSYCDTNSQVTGVVGGPLSLKLIKLSLLSCWLELRERCAAACTSSSSADCEHGLDSGAAGDRSGSLGGAGQQQGNRCSVVSSVSKPSSGTLVSLAGLLSSTAPAVSSLESVAARRARTVSGDNSPLPGLARTAAAARKPQVGRIVDPLQVYDNMNLGRRIDPYWPDPEWRAKGGRNAWTSWIPLENMEGPVVHRWTPCHRDPFNRSHTDKTILLLKIGDRFVPIAEQAVVIVSDSKKSSKEESEKEPSRHLLKSTSGTSDNEEVWTKSLKSVDSSKSLAGIPSISEREETEAEMVELRASTLDTPPQPRPS